MSGIDEFARSLMGDKNQDKTSQSGGKIRRNTYPAIVVRTDDPQDQGRIIARIISLDESGNIKGGRDKDIPDDKLPFCIPLMPGFFHNIPLEGEMVMLLLENPDVSTSPRYWIGPVLGSKLKLKFQSYREASQIFDYTKFGLNPTVSSRPNQFRVFPEKSDVAVMGRDDSMLLLRPREVFLYAGAFKRGTLNPNIEHPSFLQMRQFDVRPDNTFNTNPIEFSQMNAVSTNINLYSPRGKFRKEDMQQFELNADLQNFGETALKLHPSVYGDELIKLLNYIIQFLRTHIHTPQNPPLPSPLLAQLEEYTVDGKLQDLLSSHIRIN